VLFRKGVSHLFGDHIYLGLNGSPRVSRLIGIESGACPPFRWRGPASRCEARRAFLPIQADLGKKHLEYMIPF